MQYSVIPNEFQTKNDLVVLNIQENMNNDKSESWFLFATQLWNNNNNNNNSKLPIFDYSQIRF